MSAKEELKNRLQLYFTDEKQTVHTSKLNNFVEFALQDDNFRLMLTVAPDNKLQEVVDFIQAKKKTIENTLAPSRPPVVSGSYWDASQLRYYDVSFKNVTLDKLCAVFGCDSVTLGKESRVPLALEAMQKLTPMTLKDITYKDLLVQTGDTHLDQCIAVFAFYLYACLRFKSQESCVDDLMNSVCVIAGLQCGPLVIRMKMALALFCAQTEVSAIPDLSVLLSILGLPRVLIAEDKSETNPNKGEAQLVAEAIAVAQEILWSKDPTIIEFADKLSAFPFLLVDGCSVTFYSAKFTKAFVNAVWEGKVPAEGLEIYRSVKIDLSTPEGRKIALTTLGAIATYFLVTFDPIIQKDITSTKAAPSVDMEIQRITDAERKRKSPDSQQQQQQQQ